MSNLKVLISTHNADICGGVGSMRKFLGLYLRQEGYDVTYIFPSRTFHDMFSLKKFKIRDIDGIKSIQVRSIPYIIILEQLFANFYIKKILDEYDIFQSVDGSSIAALPFMKNKKIYVCWAATTIEDEDRLLHKRPSFKLSARNLLHQCYKILKPIICWYEGKIYRNAEKIIAISRYSANQIKRRFNIPEHKICVIPFGVDTGKFKPIEKIDDPIKKDFILMVGRATDPRKNIKLLLNAFAIVKNSFPNLELFIIGDKPDDNELNMFCIKLGIDKSVSFLGRISNDETIKYYNQAKLSVLSSFQEGLGIVVLESMACATPVVSTKSGGPEEIIKHGVDGILVENNNAEALAEGVCLLLSDEKLRRQIGIKAREHICQNYSYEIVRQKFMKIYESVYPNMFN